MLILQRRVLVRDRPTVFMLIVELCGVAFIVLCNADVGMVRDWDVFSLFGFGAVILAARVWVQQEEETDRKQRLLLMMTALIFFPTVPWILVNANEQLSRLRFEENAIRYTCEELAIFHRERKEFAKAATYYAKCLEIYPGHQRILQNMKKMDDSLDVQSKKGYIYSAKTVYGFRGHYMIAQPHANLPREGVNSVGLKPQTHSEPSLQHGGRTACLFLSRHMRDPSLQSVPDI